ncbi:hypothetical protein QA612_13125 [Evansella sp. AB-P1]|uniref:hypothetical protein n=1 Tax=Evansella sp. AB-P1 TaxID=3037653 RepID=UPI00241E397B|nr:hypothetical protein [Evansella sp. AB-P1]MDG5788425.1 hypothetical protein [Evansella sp. AB-P1]
MSECKLDHSIEDVRKKLEDQSPFLPSSLQKQLSHYINEKRTQETLNEVFHLLKKYDLSSKDEQKERISKITDLLNGN